jgi:hypothetical protein
MADKRYRLEGSTRAGEIETGVQTRIADALWMLARQWQVGEFRGEDAASPVQAIYQMRTSAITGFRSFRAQKFTPINSTTPLEAYAEQQPPHERAGFWRAAEAGMHLLQMLSAIGLDSWRDWLRGENTLDPPAQIDATEQAWVRLLVRRACDGEQIFQKRAEIAQIIRAQLTQEEKDRFDLTFDEWVGWYNTRIFSAKTLDCWDSERMEYRFAVGAGTESGAVILEAEGYPGGHLDWFSFDRRKENAQLEQQMETHDPKTVLPAPVRFAGMAAQRWWEFEDGTINFGSLSNNPADFAGMITAAFAATYGDDWYVIPIRVPIGSLAKIDSLKVLDSFGDTQDIYSIASQDGADRVWRFFELKGDGANPLLFVPAVTLGRVEGKAIESVSLIRDETENLGWGIENTYSGALERPIERRRQWAVSRVDDSQPSDAWKYRLLNPVPPNWIPFIPVIHGERAQIRLRRGRMVEWELLPPELVGIRGTTLLPNPTKPLAIYEEEVPASGIAISHAYQFARDPQGRTYLWLGRNKQPAGKLAPIKRETDSIERSAADR